MIVGSYENDAIDREADDSYKMCRIIILEPKRRPKYTIPPNSPASIPQTVVTPQPTEKIVTPQPAEKKTEKQTEKQTETINSNTKEKNAQLPKKNDVVDQLPSKSASKVERSASNVARNNQKKSKKSKDGKSSQLHQHSVPNAIRRVSVPPAPARSRLPKHVRFAVPIIDQNNKEISSADSTSSDDSPDESSDDSPDEFSDDSSVNNPPRLAKRIPPKPVKKRIPTRSTKQIPPRSTKQVQPRSTKKTPSKMHSDNTHTASSWGPSGAANARPLHSPKMVGNTPSRESDISSSADIGKTSRRMFSPLGLKENSQLPETPTKRISPLSHKFGNGLNHDQTELSPRSDLDSVWDSNSDQESAIDPDEHKFKDIDASGWRQNLRRHVDDRFNDWVTRLEHPTPLSTAPNNVHQPFSTHGHRDNRSLKSGNDPLVSNEKELDLGQTHLNTYDGIDTTSGATYYGVEQQNKMNGTVRPNRLWNHKSKQARMPPSYKVSSSVDAEGPVYYDPALKIHWRDV